MSTLDIEVIYNETTRIDIYNIINIEKCYKNSIQIIIYNIRNTHNFKYFK